MKNTSLKVIIRKKQSGEFYTDYCMAAKPRDFRRRLLKNIIMDATVDMTVMVDTNQRSAGSPIVDDAWLEQAHMHYTAIPAQSDAQQFFGINTSRFLRRQKFTEKKIIFELPCGRLPDDLLEKLEYCDIAIGFGQKKHFRELNEYWGLKGYDILFDRTLFQDYLYDSIVCNRMRSTFSPEKYLRGIADEVGI
jgi:hypothetical protein